MTGKLQIVDHDTAWTKRFEQEQARLRDACGDLLEAIEHIGSTAVPGLPAKPVIDLLATVREMALLSTLHEGSHTRVDGRGIPPEGNARHVALVEAITGLGYEYLGEYGIRRRLYFRKGPSGDDPGFHLHVVRQGTRLQREHLLFRDYLRVHSDVAEHYGRHKRELAKRYGEDRKAYTDAKAAFIAQVLRAAGSR
jgi:GrpB-like predicted nucleotidyltransferase (UPF0157 family)